MKKMLFIFNPQSGKGQIKNKLLDILLLFVKKGYKVEVYPTQKKGDAMEITKKTSKQYDRIVISGGDGTLNEVVNGLSFIEKDKRPSVGYIPAGTTNDFASNLKIPKNMIKAAELAVGENVFNCDIGLFGDKKFLYVAAFGVLTDVAYSTPQMNKNYFGQLAYILEGMKKLPNLKSYDIEVTTEDDNYSGKFIFGMASNTNYVAGIKTRTGLRADLNDGLFEVFLIKSPKNIMEFQLAISDLISQNFSSERFLIFRTKKARFKFSEEVPWTLDGEFGGDIEDVEISLDEKGIIFLSGITEKDK